MRMVKKTLIISALLSLTFFSLQLEGAQKASEKEEIKREVITREIGGEVAGLSKSFIAINYAQTARESLEIVITMDKNTRGSHKKLSEIQVGDLVNVTYEDTIETKKQEKPRVVKRLAKVVEFRQAAIVIPETSALQSQE